jgi:alpha-mannosidase
MTPKGIDTPEVFSRMTASGFPWRGRSARAVPVGLMKATFLFLSLAALLYASAGFAQERAEAGPYKQALDRLESLTILAQPEWRYHTDIPHPEDSELSDADWPTVKTHEGWRSGARVLRRWIEIPEKINGYTTLGTKVSLDLYFASDERLLITVFSNGSLIARGDDDTQQPIPLTSSAQPGQKFLIAVRLDSLPVNTRIYESQLRIEPTASRPDPEIIRTEIRALQSLIATFSEGKTGRESAVDAAVKAIDFPALDKGDQAAFDASLRNAQTKLETLKPWVRKFTIDAVGNSHIDMAWLWPWTETVEVVRNTFRTVLDLMREYPDFHFTMSSARTFSWMEEKYPDLFKEIKDRVQEGRWEIVGGMWVEPDLNMPGGESLVRQILTGKRYFQEKFGVDVKIGWNPDSFGYSWQLPQIYKKSGMDYFVTQKIYWNDTTKFPYKLFWWEAPDGSRLLSYIPHDYANDTEPAKMATDLAAYAPLMYESDPPNGREIMHLYGVGDHGGGPTRSMLDAAKRWMSDDVVYPKLHFGTARGFFEDLQKSSANLKIPTWRNEMYFEYHRGVMTTQAETKRRIRNAEELLLNAEKFSAIATLFGRSYPAEEFDDAWKHLLFDDFHDIFPGSGLAVNYLDAKRNLENVNRLGNAILGGSLNEIGSRISTQGSGVPIVIFNSLSWPRKEVIEIAAQLPVATRQVEVLDGGSKFVPSQLLSIDKETHRARLLVQANVPSLGYKTYYVRAVEKPSAPVAVVHSSADTLENEIVRVKVDAQTGCITSLFDKQGNSETLAAANTDTGGPKDSVCGNLLQAFRDKPKQWDAWNIDADFEKEHWDLTKADDVGLLERGPLRSMIRVKKHFQNSTFVQDIIVTAGSARVDVRMNVDWHEKHILLKATFAVNAHNDKATFEIPYGSIERPTTRTTPAEQAQFEVPALQWADLSDAKHGLSLLNDCKYGYDAKGNVLRLSLLRSPEWPDPHADEGQHEFTYAIYPHAESWRDAQTVRQGYELNYPLLSLQTEKHQGQLKDEFSFLSFGADNVVLTAIKKAEDDGALIIRFYEWAGKAGDVRVRLPTGAESAAETDLMEKATANLRLESGNITVPTKPYEIKTVRIEYARHHVNQELSHE